MNEHATEDGLLAEISELERKLVSARAQLSFVNPRSSHTLHPLSEPQIRLPSEIHSLILLSDSALPLGSFAYSSGLESYIAHHKPLPRTLTTIAAFHRFLELSICSIGSATLPYLLAAFQRPEALQELDNDLDASTLCTVARRASVAQGQALLSVWEKAFGKRDQSRLGMSESKALDTFMAALKADPLTTGHQLSGHFAPIWGVVSRCMGLGAHQSAYIFLVNHAKSLLSAAVRASMMGPYQAQSLLGSENLQLLLTDCLDRHSNTRVEDVVQSVPALDLWVGRHELLYSRIFNS